MINSTNSLKNERIRRVAEVLLRSNDEFPIEIKSAALNKLVSKISQELNLPTKQIKDFTGDLERYFANIGYTMFSKKTKYG